jgi:hypothetical protein
MRAWQHHQAISPRQPPDPAEGPGRTKAEVREKLQALHRELEAGIRISATYTVASCIRDWLDGLTTRRASTVENYRRLADHAIGKLGGVKLKDLTPRQVQKAWPSCRHRCRPARCGRLCSAPGLQDRSPTGNSSTGSR